MSISKHNNFGPASVCKKNITIFLAAIFFVLCALVSGYAAEEEGVCARVRIRISQDIVIARNAFKATLEITNAPQNVPLENLRVTLDIRDRDNLLANGLFGIQISALTGVNDVNGSGTVQPGVTGAATWLIVPTRGAASDQPTQYFVGGEFTYTENGNTVTMPLFPAPILVKPDPLLVLDYFLVRNVYSDDPFTP